MPLPPLSVIIKKINLPSFIKPLELVDICAESVVLKTHYLNRECITKVRLKKSYRNPLLDIKLRKKRTAQEAKIISIAKNNNVKTPVILDLDLYNMAITMTFIKGIQLKDVFNQKNENYETYFEKLGEKVALLHNANIIHGDLTTSNIIIEEKTKDLVFIDFGLGKFSTTLEDKATDLMVLKRTLESTHSKFWESSWNSFSKGYLKTGEKSAKSVLRRVEKIEQRGRHSRK